MSAYVTEDEIDKRARQFREERRLGKNVDPTALENPKKKYRYKYVNENRRRTQHYENNGYEIVKVDKNDPKAVRPRGGRITDEGTIRMGDMILMQTPRDNYIDRAAMAKARGDTMAEAFMEDAKEKINRMARDEGRVKRRGGVVFDDSQEGEERTVSRASGDFPRKRYDSE